MITTRRRRLPLIALAGSLALAAPLMLSGCSLLHLPGSNGGGISIPGVGSAGTRQLPRDLPTPDVPLLKGGNLRGLSLGDRQNKGLDVMVKVAGGGAVRQIL